VLYSRGDEEWKLADFDLTSEGSATKPNFTQNARGTPSYRPPELFVENNVGFTNKLDVWSMGCILYELAVRKRAFRDDFAVFNHSRSGQSLSIVLDSFDEPVASQITSSVHSMLAIDPTIRPSASDLLKEFKRFSEKEDTITSSTKISKVVKAPPSDHSGHSGSEGISLEKCTQPSE
jgi:serine/threonine protein kinase